MIKCGSCKFNPLPLFLLFTNIAFSQVTKVVQLDSITIEAVKRGFDVNDFINLVRNDTSFYKAFKMLHVYSYHLKSNLHIYDKSGKEKGSLEKRASQKVFNKKRWIVIEEENVSGKIFNRKKEYYSYTAEMFDNIFFPDDTLAVDNLQTSYVTRSLSNDSKMERNKQKLKTLIFNPGAQVDGVPLIGDRMAIFDEKMTGHYDYKISSENYKDTIPCYVFSCKAKQVDEIETDDKAVIKDLSSWFERKSFNTIARIYTLRYSSIFFDFDVKMDIRLEKINGVLVPSFISYDGFWDVPFRKPEVVKFNILFSNYDIPLQ